MVKEKKVKIPISDSIGKVSGLIMEAPGAKAILVLAHGAGAGMTHPFMSRLASELASRAVSTLRFNFSYMEKGSKRPDVPAIAEKTVATVIAKAHELYPRLPVMAGGKSFGGRMTSQRTSKECPEYLKGLVFFGFPLHAIGNPSTERAEHLKAITIPMLFLQGTKDKLAEIDLITKVTKPLKTAVLITWEGADHSFKAGKRDLIPELAEAVSKWVEA